MVTIDADTHVDETEDTWSFLGSGEQELKPTTGYPRQIDPKRPPTRYWIVDGKRQPRPIRDDRRSGTTVETRELLDVDARVRAMDEMGVGIQVIYPTLFLVEATQRPEVELALRRSYNRWLGAKANESQGRLRWVCLPPMMTMSKAVEELSVAKDNGACGVMKKGDREAGKWPNDPYFFPLYEEAQRLDMPICFHVGSGYPEFPSAKEFSSSRFIRIGVPVVHAFHSMLLHNVPGRFPELRFGFIEAGASWLPFVLYDLRRRLERSMDAGAADLGGNVLKANRMWVTCQVDEDLPYLLPLTGEDNLLMGSDYTHADASQELEFPRLLQERADRGEIPQSLVGKITQDNPQAFYGL